MTEYKYQYGKYENYIRIGASSSSLSSLPTPSSIGYTYSDVDKDAFTDLQGYTHRNRVRHDVLQLEISWEILGEQDISTILSQLDPVWVYVEVLDKHTRQKSVYKMYASDKKFNTFRAWKDSSNNWHEVSQAFSVTLVQE